MTVLRLFWEFLKTGLFAIGGGLATLPFLYKMAERFPWFTADELTNMIAVSESTPGPIGINMATYAGFCTAGIIGALVASAAVAAPGVGISILVSREYTKFRDNKYVKDAFYAIRPTVAALIAGAGYTVLKAAVLLSDTTGVVGVNWLGLGILAVLVVVLLKTKIHPIFLFIACGALGILLKM